MVTTHLASVLAVLATAVPAGTVLHSFHGDQATERFGWAVSELTDINRDGAKEAMVGAPRHRNAAGQVTGHVDVYSGRTGARLRQFEGAPDDNFGYSLADAGDVDRDGVADIVVGATGEGNLFCTAVPRAGKVYVYSGRTGALLWSVAGEAAGDQFGAAVGGAGDINRDGRSDIVVGAPCHDGPAGADAGAAYVLSGRDGTVLRRHTGAEPGDGFGWGVAGLGQRGDYVIGAKDAGPGDRGLVYVYSGHTGATRFTLHGDTASADLGWFFVASAGDTDRDGYHDIYAGDFCGADSVGGCNAPNGQAYVFSGRTGRLLHLFQGKEVNDGAGPGRSAGDVNRDGYQDVVVGSYTNSTGAPFGGKVTVYSGRNGRVLFEHIGRNEGETLGYDAVGLGDVNRDGRIDLLLSGALADSVYIVST